MSVLTSQRKHALKVRPKSATQHVTAGPYSPVLEVDAQRLVVLSGQVAVDQAGQVVGETIEHQTEVMLDNCARLLGTAQCGFADVFKANIYLTDLAHWERFNTIYQARMPEPLPARTAVQAILLPGFLVEVEMWAVKPLMEGS